MIDLRVDLWLDLKCHSSLLNHSTNKKISLGLMNVYIIDIIIYILKNQGLLTEKIKMIVLRYFCNTSEIPDTFYHNPSISWPRYNITSKSISLLISTLTNMEPEQHHILQINALFLELYRQLNQREDLLMEILRHILSRRRMSHKSCGKLLNVEGSSNPTGVDLPILCIIFLGVGRNSEKTHYNQMAYLVFQH